MTPSPTSNTPEERAREQIDLLLAQAGWSVQDRDHMNLGAAAGVAVREFPTDAGPSPMACERRPGTLRQGVGRTHPGGVQHGH